MSKKILIINSHPVNAELPWQLTEELASRNFSFSLLTGEEKTGLAENFKQKKYAVKRMYFGPKLTDVLATLGFCLFWLPLLVFYFFYLLNLKHKQQLDQIVCFNQNEKLLFTPSAKLLKIPTLWLEFPETDYKSMKLLGCYKRNAKRATLIAFNSRTKNNLEKAGIKDQNIKIIQPGIRLNQHNFQDTIFNKIAQAEQPKKKFVTIGTVIDLDGQHDLEPLFHAVKNSLTIVPNLQLIVVGEGKEKKNLTWVAKKLEIDSLVWFVGEQLHLRKWLDSFDLYINVADNPNLHDLTVALQAMAAGLPIIGDDQVGLEDIVFEDKNGKLLNFSNNEELTQEIILLAQDKQLREKLGTAGKERVEKYFNLAKMEEQFEKMLS